MLIERGYLNNTENRLPCYSTLPTHPDTGHFEEDWVFPPPYLPNGIPSLSEGNINNLCQAFDGGKTSQTLGSVSNKLSIKTLFQGSGVCNFCEIISFPYKQRPTIRWHSWLVKLGIILGAEEYTLK